jgi:predicted RNA polymerase sigma factor
MRGCQDMVCSACTSRGLVSSQTGDVRRKQAGPFQVKAAINACQMAEPAPDWPQTLPLYTVLEKAGHHPAARTAYGRAIALATSDSDRMLLTESR